MVEQAAHNRLVAGSNPAEPIWINKQCMLEEKEWKKVKPVLMLVLDGFGVTLTRKGNAIINANTPVFDKLWNDYPHVLLNASGEAVGLPWGEYGNSEVGHITLGMGTVIKQSLAMIKDSIVSGDFFENEVIVAAINQAKRKNGRVHLAGIFSPAGVHGHIDYFTALLELCHKMNYKNVFLHLFSDGRDVPPQSLPDFLSQIDAVIQQNGCGKIASLAGRFYSMDRISRWDRTQLTYLAMRGLGKETAMSAEEAMNNSYQKGIFDEMIMPTMIVDSMGKPVGPIEKGDTLIFINHRRDRIRQIASFFASDEPVIAEARKEDKLSDLSIVSMVFYELVNMGVKIAFTPEEINKSSGEAMSLPRVLSENGIKQYHVAETEKFPHVTYFFNGGEKTSYDGEEYKHVPSPKVRGYEEKPEMSLYEVTDDILRVLDGGEHGFILSNFANPDMIGHTGVYEAGVKAVEIVDSCVGRLVDETLKKDGTVMITADHGNCDEMLNPISGNISKEHSSNPVPFFLIDNRFRINRKRLEIFENAGNMKPNGLLADVSPTVLDVFGFEIPEEMTGVSLLDAVE